MSLSEMSIPFLTQMNWVFDLENRDMLLHRSRPSKYYNLYFTLCAKVLGGGVQTSTEVSRRVDVGRTDCAESVCFEPNNNPRIHPVTLAALYLLNF